MTLILIKIGAFFKGIAYWFWYRASLKLKLVIIGCLAGLAVLGYILWQNHKIAELQRQNQETNLNRQLVNVDILTNQLIELEKNGNVLQSNANNADRDRSNVNARDSGTFSTADNESKFCRRFCTDSTCVEWRKQHPDCR